MLALEDAGDLDEDGNRAHETCVWLTSSKERRAGRSHPGARLLEGP